MQLRVDRSSIREIKAVEELRYDQVPLGHKCQSIFHEDRKWYDVTVTEHVEHGLKVRECGGWLGAWLEGYTERLVFVGGRVCSTGYGRGMKERRGERKGEGSSMKGREGQRGRGGTGGTQ